ncbi:hypothetical protein D5086_020237 [Populus alba]|uniref:Uncharacterized protein n=1 Tax=Populus alba TaxID=43335 RepID=A0ACC4BL29_POPAL
MNLDLVLLHNVLINKEILDVLALITLELNDLAEFLVLHNIPITTEIFLESLEDLFVAQLFRHNIRDNNNTRLHSQGEPCLQRSIMDKKGNTALMFLVKEFNTTLRCVTAMIFLSGSIE